MMRKSSALATAAILSGASMEKIAESLMRDALKSKSRHSWCAKPKPQKFQGIGRNDSCPCGSGKKFKRCCINGGLS